MYSEFFGFTEKPFSIAPNPRYLYMSEHHREALAHLLYGMQGEGGVVVLTGEVGTGKTTICRSMLGQLPENIDIAYIINPKVTSLELLATICDELRIAYDEPASIKTLTDRINHHLLATHAEGRHTVLIIDEAQNLDPVVLEQLRLLTNLETDERKLRQRILIGQPELSDKLAQRDLRQLAQRITARFHLAPLNRKEVRAYIEHRLEVAGNASRTIFPAAAIRRLFIESGGIPRMINLIADRALLGAYATGSKSVSAKVTDQAVREVKGVVSSSLYRSMTIPALATAAIIAGVSLYLFKPQVPDKPVPPMAAVQQDAATIEPLAAVIESESSEPYSAVAATDMAEPSNDPVAEPVEEPVVAPTPEIPLFREQNMAFRSLFTAWQLKYDPETDGEACAFAEKHHLLCLRQQGDIAAMRNLDRPAVLALSDVDGDRAYSTITHMGGTTVSIASEDSTVEIPLNELALRSHNDFIILWQAPKDYDGPTRPGRKGDIVQHLAEQCSAAMNMQWIGAPRRIYDTALPLRSGAPGWTVTRSAARQPNCAMKSRKYRTYPPPK